MLDKSPGVWYYNTRKREIRKENKKWFITTTKFMRLSSSRSRKLRTGSCSRPTWPPTLTLSKGHFFLATYALYARPRAGRRSWVSARFLARGIARKIFVHFDERFMLDNCARMWYIIITERLRAASERRGQSHGRAEEPPKKTSKKIKKCLTNQKTCAIISTESKRKTKGSSGCPYKPSSNGGSTTQPRPVPKGNKS